MNGNMYDINYLNVPSWAKAEGMEMSVGLDQIWAMNDVVVKEKKPVVRKNLAYILHRIADKIYPEKASHSMGYARA